MLSWGLNTDGLLDRSSLVELIGSGVSNHIDLVLRKPLPVHVELCGVASRLSQLVLCLLARSLSAKRDIKLLLLLLVGDNLCDLNLVSGNVFCDGLRPISVECCSTGACRGLTSAPSPFSTPPRSLATFSVYP